MSETVLHSPETTPPPRARRSLGQRAWLIIKAIEVRLRFILVLLVSFVVIGYWDTIKNYWEKWTRPAQTATGLASDQEFYCPMHPSVVRTSLDPGDKLPSCPICGMPLSKRKKGQAAELPEGVLARVQLSPERIHLAGIETAPVDYQPLAREVRTVGYVDFDESRLSRVTSRVDGFVEKLYVDRTFGTVVANEPLAEVYSPELYSTVQELLMTLKRGSPELVASGRERLKLLGISDQEIDEIIKSGKATQRLVLRSARSGHVIRKEIVLGDRIMAGQMLFEVADLSVVWIEAEVFERDIGLLRVGQKVTASVPAYPHRTFEGQVALIHPHLESQTRTNRVRFEIANPGHDLRPGMYANVRIEMPIRELEPFKSRLFSSQAAAGEDDESLIAFQKVCPVTGLKLGSMGKPIKKVVEGKTVFLCCPACEEKLNKDPQTYLAKLAPPPEDQVLAVAERAVIDTGTRKVVYVEREPGVFEGVAVELGPRAGEFYPVLSGLSPGDRVAAAGAFLVDAETRLNPAAAGTFYGASGKATENQR
jgi:Cu(I)/Ag(I) efflux system membrane fusion protein